MAIEEKLKSMILNQYKSLRSFCEANGIPYTTFMSAINSGIANARFSTVCKIANALGVDVELLADESRFEQSLNSAEDDNNGVLEELRRDPKVKMVAKIGGKLTDEGKQDLLKYAELLRNQRDRGWND